MVYLLIDFVLLNVFLIFALPVIALLLYLSGMKDQADTVWRVLMWVVGCFLALVVLIVVGRLILGSS